MLSVIRKLENDIDVYLSPLIEDLNLSWDEKVEVFHDCHILMQQLLLVFIHRIL